MKLDMHLGDFCVAITLGAVSQVAYATKQAAGQSVPAISLAERLQWLLALLVVLGLFFLCVWLLRKIGAVNISPKNAKLHLVGGISLGMREKVVLLQAGKKQLVLAITPGRIETLAILEGDDCLDSGFTDNGRSNIDVSFAQRLMQTMKGQTDE